MYHGFGTLILSGVGISLVQIIVGLILMRRRNKR